MDQWHQTHGGTLSNFPFPLLTIYQRETSLVPATFSFKNYNHMGVFLQNQGKKSAEVSVDDFLQNISFTFLPKRMEDLPEFILREEG